MTFTTVRDTLEQALRHADTALRLAADIESQVGAAVDAERRWRSH
jgi:hypothetical protein